ncbi:MAG: hypothetical protein AAGD38_00155 [Acidobacteriota bacterium]
MAVKVTDPPPRVTTTRPAKFSSMTTPLAPTSKVRVTVSVVVAVAGTTASNATRAKKTKTTTWGRSKRRMEILRKGLGRLG